MTDDYPLSTVWTIEEIDRADELYDEHPLREVSEITGIPEGTLSGWSTEGYISTSENWYAEASLKYSKETIERAGRLYDWMPISQVSKVIDVPERTIGGWRRRGYISTDTDHRKPVNATPDRNAKRGRRADHLVNDHGYSQKEAAEKMGVSEAAMCRYLKMYRQGVYCVSDLD